MLCYPKPQLFRRKKNNPGKLKHICLLVKSKVENLRSIRPIAVIAFSLRCGALIFVVKRSENSVLMNYWLPLGEDHVTFKAGAG